MLQIINLAAQKYQGVIPADRWHEPYMDMEELASEIASGVEFWGAELDAALAGVMGIQQVLDVDLIRHAYVLPTCQRTGIGGHLLTELCSRRSRPILVGTWAAANWAIDFYKRHGFGIVQPEEAKALLMKYWAIPDRQIETLVVLRRQ